MVCVPTYQPLIVTSHSINSINIIISIMNRTPIVKLQWLAPNNVDVYVKCESENPGGSHRFWFILHVCPSVGHQSRLLVVPTLFHVYYLNLL